MKPMLDNDIDNLFKSSLEDYQINPSAGSWKKINSKLSGKHKKNNHVYWLSAASIILVFGLSFKFFGTQQEVIKLTRNISKNDIIQEEILPVENNITVTEPVVKELSLAEVKMANEKHFLAILEKDTSSLIRRKNKSKQEVSIANNKFANSFVFAIDKEITEENSKKANDLKLAMNTITDTEEPMLATAHQSKNISTFKEVDYSKERSLIKSVGNFVNFVIAKVDNRDRKLLHVSSTEESDMEITQINLGLIKYKKN